MAGLIGTSGRGQGRINVDELNQRIQSYQPPARAAAPVQKAAPAPQPVKAPTIWQRISQVGQGFNSAVGVVGNDIARSLPGGKNDFKQQQRGAQQIAKDTKFIVSQRKSGKMSAPVASNLLRNNGQGQSQAAAETVASVNYKNLGGSPVEAERTVAKGVVRYLPGGMNDLKANNAQADSALKNQAFVRGLQKSGKMNKDSAGKILKANAESASNASSSSDSIIKDMPTKGQLIGGLAKTGVDAVSAGAGTRAVLSKGVSKMEAGAGRDAAVNSLLSRSKSNIMLDAGRAANAPKKILVNDLSTATKSTVSDIRANGKGISIKDTSTPTQLKPSRVTSSGYSTEFKKISSSYDKQSADLAKLPPTAQKVRQEAIDAQAQKAIDDLNTRSAQTQFTVKDLKAKTLTLAAKDRPVVGKQVKFEDLGTRPTTTGVIRAGDATLGKSTGTAERALAQDAATGTSKIASDIAEKASGKALRETYGELAQYDKITVKDQAARATKLIEGDRQELHNVIDGKKPLPEGLRATSIITAIENHPVLSKDTDLLLKVAKSSLPSESSYSAQELRLAAERMHHSPVEAIKSVQAARIKSAERRAGMSVAEATKKTVKEVGDNKIKVTRETWDSFIESIRCS